MVVSSVEYECATCCRTKCQAKLCLFLFLAGIVPTFIFGSDRAKLFFWLPKPLLAVGTRELVAFILGSIFLAVKSVFGRILPKIKVGTISAKNKSWQTQPFYLLFARTHCHSLCISSHTPPATGPLLNISLCQKSLPHIQHNTPHNTSTPPIIPPPDHNVLPQHGGRQRPQCRRRRRR